ncbi:MAG: hypothetical protein ACPGNV_03780 [Mangrovicoccus sp.]
MRRHLIAGLAFLAIAGCEAGFENGPGGGMGALFGAAPSAEILLGQAVTIRGPQGFCVDRSSKSDRAAGAFVLLANCAHLSRRAETPLAPVEAVLTALVSPAIEDGLSPSAATLEDYFRSDLGRAALARDGKAGSVQILRARQRGDVLYLKLRDTGPGGTEGLRSETWRAIFTENERLVVLSAAVAIGSPSDDGLLFGLVQDFVTSVRQANLAESEGEAG